MSKSGSKNHLLHFFFTNEMENKCTYLGFQFHLKTSPPDKNLLNFTNKSTRLMYFISRLVSSFDETSKVSTDVDTVYLLLSLNIFSSILNT